MQESKMNYKRIIVCILVLIFLAACGSGSGGDTTLGDNPSGENPVGNNPAGNNPAADNAAPIAHAGPDQNIATGAVVTLDGSMSSDVDGDTLTYSWSFTSIPVGSTAALSSATVVNPSFTADKDGAYVLSLVVNDGTVNSMADTMTITATAAATISRQWTYLVYMGADNNLSDAGLGDLNEMETVGSSANMAIVVQAEFSTQYTQGMTSSSTRRIAVQHDNDPNSANLNGIDIGNVDMASPAALTSFITWAQANYPAQHYALVVWDHGAGWKAGGLVSPLKGAVQDETSGTFMSLPDLAKGIADSGVHFDIINFDACLMAMYEVAYEFNGLADYLVFSEQTEPGEGDPYDTILADLAATPSMSGRTLASTIVSKYDAFYTTNNRGGTTKSAVDMTKLVTLDTKLLSLAAALQNDGASPAVVQTARSSTQEYAYASNHDIWAFSDFLVNSAAGSAVKTAAAEVKTTVSDMVVANETNGTDMSNSHGLAIYLPLANETNTAELATYSLLACNKTARAAASGTWGSYLETLIGAGGGGTATYRPGNFGIKIVWTNTTGAACNADVDLYVWEPTPSGSNDLYAPWMGQTSPNGYFSLDSADSGKSEESYLANALVLAGDYYFLVNYYQNGASCTAARVHLSVYDPASFGDSNWHEATSGNLGVTLAYPSPQDLDLSNPWTNQTINSITDLNNYSDWWVPFYIAKAANTTQIVSGSNLLELNKRSQMIVRLKKGSRLFGIGN